MNVLYQAIWQANIEISLLLLVIFLVRYAIRKTTRVYNAYLLWLSIPAGLVIARLVGQFGFSQPPVESVTLMVQNYIVQPAQAFDAWTIPGISWLIIAGLLLLRLIYQHRQLRRDLAHIKVAGASVPTSEYPVIGILKEDFSPAVYGFLRPAIYFPLHLLQQLSPAQIKLIIQHEEHHIKQRHLWLNLLWDILVCCMWFNPLVYISRQNFRHDQELFCDYLVLNQATRQDHRSYGLALLSTVSATHSVSLLCSWKTFNQLEERIMNTKQHNSFINKLSLVLGGLAIIACTSIYTVSATESSTQESTAAKSGGTASRHIEINMDDTTWVEKHGEQYILEGDSKRPMNEQERREFEEKIKITEQEMMRAEKEMGEIDMEIDGETHEKRLYKIEIERHEKDLERHQQELDQQEKELGQQEMERHQQQLKLAELETEQAMQEIERSYRNGELEEQHMLRIQEDLIRARQDIRQSQKQLPRDTQRARQDIQRAQAELQRTQLGLQVPEPQRRAQAPREIQAPLDQTKQSGKQPEAPKPIDALPVQTNPAPMTTPI